jgi:uncharacterized coiled-coil DUF342 family protein
MDGNVTYNQLREWYDNPPGLSKSAEIWIEIIKDNQLSNKMVMHLVKERDELQIGLTAVQDYLREVVKQRYDQSNEIKGLRKNENNLVNEIEDLRNRIEELLNHHC